MRRAIRRAVWAAGRPARAAALAVIRVYRASLSGVLGGQCRFYPSCSAYAEAAIRDLGVVRGGGLAAWRVLRCSPLSAGGVDYPPSRRSGTAHRTGVYDAVIPSRDDVAVRHGGRR